MGTATAQRRWARPPARIERPALAETAWFWKIVLKMGAICPRVGSMRVGSERVESSRQFMVQFTRRRTRGMEQTLAAAFMGSMTTEWPRKEEYLEIRRAVDASKEGQDLIEWASRIERPKNADDLAKGLASAVLSSGFGYRPAMSVWKWLRMVQGNSFRPRTGATSRASATATAERLAHRPSLSSQGPSFGETNLSIRQCHAHRAFGLRDFGTPTAPSRESPEAYRQWSRMR